jgi:cytochrome c peroxidase
MSAAAHSVRTQWVADLDSLQLALSRLDTTLQRAATAPGGAAREALAAQFLAARLAFKRTELLSAYYEPTTTRSMNGPALPRVDEDEGPAVIVVPEGFQVIEEQLFANERASTEEAERARSETRNLINLVTRVQTTARQQQLTDDRIFDAAKMEIARVVSLGLVGYDSPIAKYSLEEASASLESVHRAMLCFRDGADSVAWLPFAQAYTRALQRLASPQANVSRAQQLDRFNRFNRLEFIVAAANPLARSMSAVRNALRVGVPAATRAFRTVAATLFDSAAFAAEAFAPPGAVAATESQVSLGRALFFEARLSEDGGRACASCHDPARAFTDGHARSVGRSGRPLLRNAPTIINAGLQVGSFYDLRTTYLEDQVADVLGNVDEMHGNPETAAARLLRDSVYRARFASAYPAREEAPTRAAGHQLRGAIASYIRSLTALNSRVDRALRGDTLALDADERSGFTLFMGKAACGTCHFAPLFNGTLPPTYRDTEIEVIGVPDSPVTRGARVDPDSGRARQTHAALHQHAFKVPGLRNAALTSPYMHNGVYRTLEEVVDFYNRGGGAGIGVRLEHQTLPREPLQLTARERYQLVRFLGALTDTVGTTQR